MSIEKYLEEMKNIRDCIINYLDFEGKIEENSENLKDKINNFEIHNNRYKLKSALYIIVNVSNNHYRVSNFFEKIERILLLLKDDIKTNFTNSELFHIFGSNKRILLFLFESNIMTVDKFIIQKIFSVKTNKFYPEYFTPEIQPFINDEWFEKNWVKKINKELPNDFKEKRKYGENDEEICRMIRKDLIEEFIIYVNKNSYPLKTTINPSIYETNSFLLKDHQINLIEYAAFFGSIQIFNYLRLNGINLLPSLWLYAIHGQNAEIIHILEENKINPNDKSYKECLKESTKCHHNDIFNYIHENYILNESEKSNDNWINSLKYYNINFEQIGLTDQNSFFFLCKYDYYFLVDIILKDKNIDINMKTKYVLLL